MGVFLQVLLILCTIELGFPWRAFQAEHPKKILEVEGCGLPSLSGRVRGGANATNTQFPWVVAVLYRGALYCTGTLITTRHVLTAGHCKKPIGSISVRYGSNGDRNMGDTVKVEAGSRHPQYDDGESDLGRTSKDAWILTLERELETSSKVRPICLSEDVRADPGMAVIIAGYGAVDNPYVRTSTLRYTMSRILSPLSRDCQELMGEGAKSELCIAKGINSVCKGDSGGPAMRIVDGVYYQVGITSYGGVSSECPECACPRPFTPQAFARVALLGHFIDSVCA